MTNIIYTDSYNKAVTNQQLLSLKDYQRHIYENSELKITEYWSFSWMQNKVVADGGLYFVSQLETLSEVFSRLTDLGGRWTVYYNKQPSPQGNTLWEYQTIYKGVTETLAKIVFDNQKREIAESVFSELKNHYSINSKKFYGDPNIFPPAYEGAPSLTFIYESLTGKPLDVLCEYGSEEDNEYLISQFFANQNIMAIFQWNQHPYFHNFEPMLP